MSKKGKLPRLAELTDGYWTLEDGRQMPIRVLYWSEYAYFNEQYLGHSSVCGIVELLEDRGDDKKGQLLPMSPEYIRFTDND